MTPATRTPIVLIWRAGTWQRLDAPLHMPSEPLHASLRVATPRQVVRVPRPAQARYDGCAAWLLVGLCALWGGLSLVGTVAVIRTVLERMH